jgi:hypothetical protein
VRAIYVPLSSPLRRALVNLAESEYRDPRDQAAYLILEGLRQRGALPESTTAAGRQPANAVLA